MMHKGNKSGTSGLSDESSPKESAAGGLLFRLNTFVLGVGEPVQLGFQLWKKNEFITDTFWVLLDAKLMPENPRFTGDMGKIRTVFRDVSMSELCSGDVWLVCRITRTGVITLDKKCKTECRRPIGISVQQITKQLVSGKQPMDASMDIYSCPMESQFGTLQETLMGSVDRSGLLVVPKTSPLRVSLHGLASGHGGDLLEAHPWIAAESVAVTERLLASRSADRRMNRLLVTLVSCEGVAVDKSVEVVIEALDERGKEVPDAFLIGEPRKDFRSWVMKRVANPVWREQIVLDLDIVSPPTTSLYFAVNHVTKQKTVALGCAVLPLTSTEGTVLANMTHSCAVFKLPKRKADVKTMQIPSVPAPSSSSSASGSQIASGGAKNGGPLPSVTQRRGDPMLVMHVATRLDSTELSQNASMYALLQWQADPSSLHDTLTRFMYVEQAEIVRFLPDAIGALFEVLALKDGKPETIDMAFYCLIHILSTLLDERSTSFSAEGQENLRAMLDRYVKEQFVESTADETLIKCLLQAFENSLSNKKRLVGVLKSMGYLLLFIYRSIELRMGAKKPSLDDLSATRKRLGQVFAAVFKLTSTQNVALLSVQATAVRSFASWTSYLSLFFPPKELAGLYGQMLNSIPAGSSIVAGVSNNQFVSASQSPAKRMGGSGALPGAVGVASGDTKQNLTGEKLGLMFQLVVTPNPVFVHAEAREDFFAIVIEQVESCLESKISAEKTFARQLLIGLIEAFQTHLGGTLPDEALTLVPLVLLVLKAAEAEDLSAEAEAVTVFLFFIKRLGSHQFLALFGPGGNELFRDCLRVIERLVTGKALYDPTWFAMIMFQYGAVFRFFEMSKDLFPSAPKKLVISLSQLCLVAMSSEALALSSFSQTKRSLIEDLYGDLRLGGLNMLKVAFARLQQSAEKAHEARSRLVPMFLQMLLINEAEIKQTGGLFYWTSVRDEIAETEAFLDVLTLTIDVLGQPRAVTGNLGSRLMRLLQKRFQSSPEVAEIGEDFVMCISEFEALLKSIHLLPPTPDYDIERTMATLCLLDYLAQAESSSYNSYALPVLQQNLKENLLAEAAAVLMQMAANLSGFEDEILEPMELVWGSHAPFPEESSRVRRERMLQDAVSLLEKDCQYEKAVSLLQEMHPEGKETGAMRERLAKLEQRMNTEERLVTEYFRVGFYGKGFCALNGTALIFRGALLERLDEFNTRMLQQFPAAQLLSYTSPPPPELIEGEGQSMQIFRVLPSTTEEMESTDTPEVDLKTPLNIRRFRRYNDCSVFLYEKPVKKGKSGSEVADLWINMTFFVTDMELPSISRFASVIEIVEREVSPVELAVRTMADKNTDLKDAMMLYGGKSNAATPSDAQPFISLVQGTVDAAVGGGFRTYEDVFFGDKYGEWDQEIAGQITELITEQIQLMGDALQLWPKVCPAMFQPLLEHLQSQYEVIVSEK